MKWCYKYYGDILSVRIFLAFKGLSSTLEGYHQYDGEYSVHWNCLHHTEDTLHRTHDMPLCTEDIPQPYWWHPSTCHTKDIPPPYWKSITVLDATPHHIVCIPRYSTEQTFFMLITSAPLYDLGQCEYDIFRFQNIFMKDSNTLAFYNFTSSSMVALQLKERGGRKK